MKCTCTPKDLFNFGCKCGFLNIDRKENTRKLSRPMGLSVNITHETIISNGLQLGFTCEGNGEKVVVLFVYEDKGKSISEIIEITHASEGTIGKASCHPFSLSDIFADRTTKYWVHVKIPKRIKNLGLRKGKIKARIVKQM